MNNFGRNIFFWIILLAVLVIGYDMMQGSNDSGNNSKLAFSEFLAKVENNQVSEVVVRGRNIEGKMSDGSSFTSFAPDYPSLVDKLRANGVKIDAQPLETKGNAFVGILIQLLPVLILVGLWLFFMRQMQGGGGKAMGFGKSKAKLLSEGKTKVTFEDVAGIEEAKEELAEIVDFLRNPHKFQALGGKIPKGCLLIGPPGTGKTLLAKAIAGEANVPFFSISGSDFVEMFVGVGASRVRDMFEQGKKNAPCIIFIDEIDAVGRHRGIGLGGGNDEREQTLNQLLVEMDGFEANEGVIIIAATNRPDVLDPALLRPGRFDRQINVSLPDLLGREKIINVHLKKIVTGPDVEAKVIARGTPGFSGADLANVVNEAALLAARNNKKIVTLADLEGAKDKVLMGMERKSMVMSEEERKLTAYHEGGHAIVTLNVNSDPIHKATIIPRGRALGLVMRLPESDRVSVTKERLKADIAVAMGGRVAEEIIFGHDKITSGASSDIQQATKIATAMVTEWGMSDKIGPIFIGGNSQDLYGHSMQAKRSESTEGVVDNEIKSIVDEGYKTAQRILNEKLDHLHTLAKALLEYETLSGDEIKHLLAGKDLDREKTGIKEGANDEAKNISPKKSSFPSKHRKKETLENESE